MPKEEIRLFIALVPPEPIYTEVWGWKTWFRDEYQTHKALNSPPHITLQMPFRWAEKGLPELQNHLQTFCQARSPFPIALSGFAAFPPRVIYLDVAPSETLFTLQKELTRSLRRTFGIHHATHRDNGFVPHLTVAFRDLKKSAFLEAWEQVKDKPMNHPYTQGTLSLLRHNGQVWEAFDTYPLG